MIEIRNLTKSYPTELGRKYVFRNLNFAVPEGSGIGLLGRNGAGKSTLLRILGGIEAADRGKVVTDKSISWPVGLGSGFQGSLSARENVRFVCRVLGANGEEMKAKEAFVEEFAEIGEYFDLPLSTYSSGMRARVTFGTSMAFDYDYYLIDEVMAVGDPNFRKKASAVFRDKLQKASVILVSHNMNDIREMCTAVIVVERGEAAVYKDLAEGIEAYTGALKGSAKQ
jgi:capsular polysaccharide transport system ATP-binding protein